MRSDFSGKIPEHALPAAAIAFGVMDLSYGTSSDLLPDCG
jgi:hypothetical protein